LGFDINQFRASYANGGSRPSLFQVQISNPANPIADLDIPFKVYAASIPEHNILPINVYYFGRPIKVAGNRTFGDWQVEIYNDEDFIIRDALEQWSNTINGVETNINKFGTSSPSAYKSDAMVTQYSQAGDALRSYTFVGLFPINVGAMTLNWSAGQEVHTYPVTFSVDYFFVNNSITGAVAGGL
jgi:hypothetical protein